ncbi:MAG: type II toxin-antitoxin system HicA family toxin [Gemmatimonadetes bacterium]|nr:type II toxin-antitoxin system HicA family toxin [Gemmatimonadota bacterium]MYD26812.1 type II toxin-antitoxin system HicA family toxin [Gemmatimonadota bacterium]
MNSRQRKTLEAVFTDPVSSNIEWRQIETLLVSVGCELIEGRGSRIAFKYGTHRADFHRPHPGKEAKPYQVRAAREFLTCMGVTP